MWYVYLLVSTNNSTYIGATINLEHRLRQHNGEIKGGAVATSIKVKAGEVWKRVCHISGFPSWPAALQFEWRWKQLSRKLSQKMFPLERRIQALIQLLKLEKPTTKSLPYSEWTAQPKVDFEIDEALNLYNKYNVS
jgi:structure-specific endonuclease subunit SLX1